MTHPKGPFHTLVRSIPSRGDQAGEGHGIRLDVGLQLQAEDESHIVYIISIWYTPDYSGKGKPQEKIENFHARILENSIEMSDSLQDHHAVSAVMIHEDVSQANP